MITPKQIKTTKTYMAMDHIQRMLITKRHSIIEIELGVNMSKAKGFEFWSNLKQPRYYVLKVVEDLVQKKSPN